MRKLMPVSRERSSVVEIHGQISSNCTFALVVTSFKAYPEKELVIGDSYVANARNGAPAVPGIMEEALASGEKEYISCITLDFITYFIGFYLYFVTNITYFYPDFVTY